MAEIIVAPLLQVIFDKIADPVLQEVDEFWELSDRFEKLRKMLPMAQAVIQDAEERQVTEEAVRLWLSQLKDATTKVEDLLQELECRNKKPVNYRKNRDIVDDLQKALAEGLNLRLAERVRADRKFDERETSSFLYGSEIHGREEDKAKILERLLRSSAAEASFVVPIYGAPGVGKTALAQMVYNDDEVKNRFDLRIWVFVSPDLKVKRIIRAAIESATGNKCDLEELDALELKLRNILHRQRCLLVLDDVWSDHQDDWDRLKLLFSCGSNGSRILVTTCSQKVSMIVGSPYRLYGLPEEDCWALFKKRAFVDRAEEKRHPNLLEVGREIVRKCRGLPLAAKVVGGLMRFKRDEMDWLHVQNSNLWDLRVYRINIFPALLVSYLQLPPHLKHCFVFCSVFPKSHEIDRKMIIHSWMVHGFILSDGYKAKEDIGDEYFNELLWLSVLEEIREPEGGSVRKYRVNENFHNLARFLGGDEFLVVGNGLELKSVGQIRHVSLVPEFGYSPPLIPDALHQSKHLRTLLVFSEGGLETFPIISSFSYLRELKLRGCLFELPESIGDLKLLGYLDVSYGHFKKLPKSISYLRSLQVLDAFWCCNLTLLPPMDKITGLRHLNIGGCEALLEMPSGVGKLLRLQTLPIYIVPIHLRESTLIYPNRWFPNRNPSDSSVRSIEGSLYDIRRLGLRDELKIKHLERVRCVEEARAADLTMKARLRSLGLCWGNDYSNFILEENAARFQGPKQPVPGPSDEPQTSSVPGPSDEPQTSSDLQLAGEVLEALHPPKHLNKLFVVGYPGMRFPFWTLPNLIKLVLISCEGCLHLPTLGHLPLLKSLHMQGMSELTSIGRDFYGDQDVATSFPSLQELVVAGFPNLQEWLSPNDKVIFPVLGKLTLRNCENLTSVPLITSLKHLELHGCNPAILNCLEGLSRLSSLVIDGFGDLISIPENLLRDKPHLECATISSCPKLQFLPSDFTALKSLTIRWCEELSVLPYGFQNLTTLEIGDCHSLITLPENVLGQLTSLQTLSIENCSLLNSISMRFQHLEYLSIMYCPSLASFSELLSSLRSLSIISCPLIQSLPDGIKTATQLRSLEIRSCPGITNLPEWFDNFGSLRSLAISECQNLKALPVAIRRLSKLQHLSIQECPHLQRRCQRDRGEDWWKIAHIPHRYIHISDG